MTQRYKEDPLVRSMRVRTWFHAVALASSLTAAELERKFAKADAKGAGSCIWDKYRRGEVVPRGAESNRLSGLVERVEAFFPGTAVWLLTPFWRLVDKAPLEMSEIRRVYESMPSAIRSLFVVPPRTRHQLFWRRFDDAQKTCASLLRLGNLESVTAHMALIREGETCQDTYTHSVAIARLRDHFVAARSVSATLRPAVGLDLQTYLVRQWRHADYSHDPSSAE